MMTTKAIVLVDITDTFLSQYEYLVCTFMCITVRVIVSHVSKRSQQFSGHHV